MLEYLLLIIGFALLIKGADYLIDGASELAKKIGVSSFVIGLTIVAFGTSLPELIVNVTASIKGSQGIVLGNIIGSNLANILLVLGTGALFLPLKVNKEAIKKDWPMNVAMVTLLLLFVNNSFSIVEQSIGFYEGLILIILFTTYLLLTMNSKNKKIKIESKSSSWKITIKIIVGLIALYFGSELVVNNAVIIAKNFGISEFIIGTTIVALGTSLPELFTVIIGVLKKEPDLSLGTILGSNLFNITLILGVSAMINPIKIISSINFNLIFLLLVTILLGALILSSKNKFSKNKKSKNTNKINKINKSNKSNKANNLVLKRWHGAILFVLYCCYIVFMFWR